MTVWGTGSARREFLHVDDLADASVRLMEIYDEPEIVNPDRAAGGDCGDLLLVFGTRRLRERLAV